MTPHKEFQPTVVSPIESGLSTATCTSAYTADVFDRINDGSYKDHISIFSPCTPLTAGFDPEAIANADSKPDSSNIRLIKEFESTKEHDATFDRKALDKSLTKAVRAFDRLWLASRELKAKNNNTINGECIYMKLQINHIQITKINLAIRLHDYYYSRVISIIKEYEDPYNDIPSIKREILRRMPPIFEEFHDTVLKIQYLDSEINKLNAIIQNRRGGLSLKLWLWCKIKGISLD